MATRFRRSALRQLRQQQGKLHVSLSRQDGQQVIELKDEPDVLRSPPDSRPPPSSLIRTPPTSTAPPVGESRPPIKLSKVVLPEPEGPISARKSPFGMSRFHALQNLDALAATAEVFMHVTRLAPARCHPSSLLVVACGQAGSTHSPLTDAPSLSGGRRRDHRSRTNPPAISSCRRPRRPFLTARRSTRSSAGATNTKLVRCPCERVFGHRLDRRAVGLRPWPKLSSLPASRRNVTLTPMSGRIRVELLEADAHEHGRFLPIGGRHRGDHTRRNLPSRGRH